MGFLASGQVIVQGVTEPLGLTIVPLMQRYGTRLVAGVASGLEDQVVADLPVANLVQQVVADFGPITTSIICVSPYRVLDAALEAMQMGIRQLVLMTQGVPPLDMLQLVQAASASGTLVLGGNTPGLIMPGQNLLLGIHPPQFYAPGKVGIISRNGTLTYEVARNLTATGFGQSIALSIGADSIVGSTLSQWLQILEMDEQTEAIVLVGQVGSDAEEIAAQCITESITKPVVAYIAGQTAPRHRRLGHANVILESQSGNFGSTLGTVASKTKALQRAGVPVAESPAQLPELLQHVMDMLVLETA
ncbi:CoA-binding protein [filamentous cyanobacterium LEGE 11480]|uniref:CoA-binding protein n=1 Tax=Romeriopsis navalis LEGE 11480 TaxID=2777977 RepID=A0A928VSZ6_9CYAN|nr:CoA-binding protein [Romeriopsis navalis]MBE9032456.1 CoA-binding protein [Romeriopsis navalis LEGE 11480]